MGPRKAIQRGIIDGLYLRLEDASSERTLTPQEERAFKYIDALYERLDAYEAKVADKAMSRLEEKHLERLGQLDRIIKVLNSK